MAFVGSFVGTRNSLVTRRALAPRMCNASDRRRRLGRIRLDGGSASGAASVTASAATPATEQQTVPSGVDKVKEFLNSLGGLGRVRLVQNNGVTVLESITPMDKLFYAEVRGFEYGNVIDHKLNVDLHIKVSAVAGARFEIGKRGESSTYAIRLLGADNDVVLSMFVQWDKEPSDVEPERIACWNDLKARFAGDSDTASFK